MTTLTRTTATTVPPVDPDTDPFPGGIPEPGPDIPDPEPQPGGEPVPPRPLD